VNLKKLNSVTRKDLEHVCACLEEEFPCLAGKRLLITGGAGFLGYYFIKAIQYWNTQTHNAQNIQLTVYDNFIRGIPDWLLDWEKDKNLTLVKHDVSISLPEHIEDFQYIIHAASIASPYYYRLYPIETMDANVNGLRLLLEYSLRQLERNRPIEGFLFLSSSEIYGTPSPEYIPTPENYYGYVSCTGPRACYDESKRYGETLCVNFARRYDLPIKIARPFNNYGPGLKITDRRLLPDFARDILAEKDVVMLSDGSPTRTFCYVAVAIVGYYKTLVRGRSGEAYNIGAESPEISIADFATLVVEMAGDLFDYKGCVVRQLSGDPDYLTDNPSRRCPSISKAKTDLDYNPTIALEEGLKRSLIWYYFNRYAEEA